MHKYWLVGSVRPGQSVPSRRRFIVNKNKRSVSTLPDACQEEILLNLYRINVLIVN